MNRIKDLRIMIYKLPVAGILSVLYLIGSLTFSINAQSTTVEYPTPVSTNEINGTISARDLGDARLTSYYYTFNGTQGDIFINVSASNFTGDIDLFIADGLRPLTKISFYADSSVRETGRVIYLRKPEKLLLRVEGRTPDDKAATFTIKFAGSFVAVQDNGMGEAPEIPKVKSEDTNGIRVNSVGTIIRPEPKPTPETKEKVTDTNTASTDTKTTESEPKVAANDNVQPENKDASEKTADAKDDSEKEVTAVKTPLKRRTTTRNTRNGARRTTTSGRAKTTAPAAKKTTETATETVAEPKPNPLENVRMTVLMKDGEKIEFPMTEVFRFSMNNGILTVVTKDGKIHRHSILDIQKFSIE